MYSNHFLILYILFICAFLWLEINLIKSDYEINIFILINICIVFEINIHFNQYFHFIQIFSILKCISQSDLPATCNDNLSPLILPAVMRRVFKGRDFSLWSGLK